MPRAKRSIGTLRVREPEDKITLTEQVIWVFDNRGKDVSKLRAPTAGAASMWHWAQDEPRAFYQLFGQKVLPKEQEKIKKTEDLVEATSIDELSKMLEEIKG